MAVCKNLNRYRVQLIVDPLRSTLMGWLKHALIFSVRQWNFPDHTNFRGLSQNAGSAALSRDCTQTSWWYPRCFAVLLSAHIKSPSNQIFLLSFQGSSELGQAVSHRLEQLTKLLYTIEDKVKYGAMFQQQSFFTWWQRMSVRYYKGLLYFLFQVKSSVFESVGYDGAPRNSLIPVVTFEVLQ